MRGGPWASGLGWREKGPDHTPRWDTCMACALSKLTPHIQKSLSMIVRRWSNSQRWEQSEPESSAQHLSSSRESSLRDTTRIAHGLGSMSHPEGVTQRRFSPRAPAPQHVLPRGPGGSFLTARPGPGPPVPWEPLTMPQKCF